MRRRAFIAGAAAAVALPARAQDLITGAEALSGDRFTANGAEFILADVIAPPLYRLGEKAPPHFEASRMALGALLNSPLNIEEVSTSSRWGAHVVHAAAEGQSVQEALVAAGAVRVAPQSGRHVFIKTLLALEVAARAQKLGLWTFADNAVFDAASADKAIGAYHLVEGEVISAEKHGSRFYLNFGPDYRTDFTAGAASRLQKGWAKKEIDLASLQGKRVRVRGFVEAINGPSIDLKHPLQIELLDGANA